jgi:hypothetical protein
LTRYAVSFSKSCLSSSDMRLVHESTTFSGNPSRKKDLTASRSAEKVRQCSSRKWRLIPPSMRTYSKEALGVRVSMK